MTVYELTNDFREKYMKERLRATTLYGYENNIKNHILPDLYYVEISDLNCNDIDLLTAKLHNKHLSNKSIVYVHATMRKMLNYAKKRGYIDNNVYDQIDLPKIESYKYVTMNERDLKRLFEKIKNSELEVPVRLAACYGLRRGEILGLRNGDLDHEHNVLHIQRTKTKVSGKEVLTPCKTENGDRYILISDEHKSYFGKNKNEYVVKMSQYVLNTHFSEVVKELGYKGFRFHDLRHTYATIMMVNGINPKIVCNVLGHSDVSVTLEIYSHPDISMQKQCLDFMKKSGL